MPVGRTQLGSRLSAGHIFAPLANPITPLQVSGVLLPGAQIAVDRFEKQVIII